MQYITAIDGSRFRLEPRQIVEVGKVFYKRQAKRSEIRKAFKNGGDYIEIVSKRNGKRIYNGTFFALRSLAYSNIGCKYFSGNDAAKLNKWAGAN